ncbi:sigma-70 family RNA polymerase sigma factor [Olsenella phocaeensis]|uniref:sigma-70 family RNA polymerase sigma factor n=1 Tax=Olsenella phocaeensis TaxID=1852385 RepID=UPI0028DD3181|nr:sigma-70 family RNA polymerase sigma factor [uncultured Olsenella sp.]
MADGRERVQRSDAFVRDAMSAWGDSVLRLALAQTGSRADAEDVYQDVFVSLACSPTKFESDEHLKAWLLRVTINRCHDLRRTWWWRHIASMEELDREPSTPEDPTSDSVVGGRGHPEDSCPPLWDALRRLPERYRTPVFLFYVEEMSCARIAEVAGCRESTVRTRLQRGREKLRKTLEGLDYEAI